MGIGSKLLELAKEHTPTMLYFGSQQGIEEFYEKNGCKKSLQSYIIEKDNTYKGAYIHERNDCILWTGL